MNGKKRILAAIITSFLFTIFLSNSSYSDSLSEGTGSVLNVIEPLTINYIKINPSLRMIFVNSTINVTMNATSGNGIDKEYAIITLPNGSTSVEFLPMNYTAPFKGIYNITFFANDTAGNIVNSSDCFYTADIFLAGNQKKNIQTRVVNGTTDETRAYLKTYLSEGMLWIHNFTCDGICTYEYLSDFLYDYEHHIDSALTTVTFRRINNSIDFNNTLQYQRHINPENGSVLVVAIGTNYTSYTSANLIMNYSDTSYNYEGNLSLQKCNSWSFDSASCLVSWINVTTGYSQNQAKNIFDINVTSFSAYRIVQPYITTYCGDGTCNGAETGASCPADCTTSAVITNTITHTSTKTIETIIEKMIEAPAERITASQIYLEIFPGGRTESTINVENPTSKETTVKLSTEGEIGEFIRFEEPVTKLGPGEERNALFIISAEDYAIPGYYTGNIIVEVNGKKTKSGVVLKVLTPSGKLLDVEITPSQETYFVGDDLIVEIELFNLGGAKKIDVDLKLEITDEKTGEIVASSEDSVAVQTSATKLKRFENIFKKSGTYVILATAKYVSDSVETTGKSRRSVKVKENLHAGFWAALTMLLVFFFLFVYSKFVKCYVSGNNIFIKNISWLPREASMIFLVSNFQEHHKKVSLFFNGEKFEVKTFSGTIENFFKNALKSGPIMTNYNGKTIIAIKNKKDFISLFKEDEVIVECPGKILMVPKIFFATKKHQLAIETDLKIWNLIENDKKGIEYFEQLYSSLKKLNFRSIVLEKYFENIISILR